MENPDSLVEFISEIEKSLSKLKPVLASNPRLRVNDILRRDRSEPAATVRTILVDIFDRTSKVLGRNSPGAITADTKILVESLADTITPYTASYGDHVKWITQEIQPHADPDMVDAIYTAEVYHHPHIPVFKRFYQSLANLRRTRPSVALDVAMQRPIHKK